ncbi:uncharacterized protein LOC124198323 [Daphnia pulex]|uniref:uncharacterized protein LOC124198323 n=1 Tax=Daphnia pulex TaxID=6669 RepID=UPI001EDDE6D3|nr:uncharacterized protein LOC124198323 [Daphnia pulex]
MDLRVRLERQDLPERPAPLDQLAPLGRLGRLELLGRQGHREHPDRLVLLELQVQQDLRDLLDRLVQPVLRDLQDQLEVRVPQELLALPVLLVRLALLVLLDLTDLLVVSCSRVKPKGLKYLTMISIPFILNRTIVHSYPLITHCRSTIRLSCLLSRR